MNLPNKRDDEGILLTIEQTCRMANLGASTVRQIAKESGAERKIGRSYRINKQFFFDYIEKNYSL